MAKAYSVTSDEDGSLCIHSTWSSRLVAFHVAELMNAGYVSEDGLDLPGQQKYKVEESALDATLVELGFATGVRGEYNHAWHGSVLDEKNITFRTAAYEDGVPSVVTVTPTDVVVVAATEEECVRLVGEALNGLR